MRISKGAKKASAELLIEMRRKGKPVSKEAQLSAAEEITGVKSFGLTATELEFFARSTAKGMKLYRSGWPDFLVEIDGRTIGVEVKSIGDQLRKEQKLMFAALERAGIQVYVWWERFPDRLIPWRNLKAALKRERDASSEEDVRRLLAFRDELRRKPFRRGLIG